MDCFVCGNTVSDKGKICPSCGEPDPWNSSYEYYKRCEINRQKEEREREQERLQDKRKEMQDKRKEMKVNLISIFIALLSIALLQWFNYTAGSVLDPGFFLICQILALPVLLVLLLILDVILFLILPSFLHTWFFHDYIILCVALLHFGISLAIALGKIPFFF